MSDKPYFPLFVDLSEKHVLVVGAGKIALRRIRAMAEFAGHVTIVAPDLHPEVMELAEHTPHLRVLQRGFQPEDLEGADLVLAATNRPDLNGEIARLCREKDILVNACHNKDLCDFYFPGIVHKDPLVIGVTACGKDHAVAKEAVSRIREIM